MDSKGQHPPSPAVRDKEMMPASGYHEETFLTKGPLAPIRSDGDLLSGLALVWDPWAHALDVRCALPPVERVSFEMHGTVWTTLSRLGLYVYHVVHSRDGIGFLLSNGHLPLPFFPQGMTQLALGPRKKAINW